MPRNSSNPIKIYARWDADAKVWVATSEDVPGLVTEAEDIDLLVKKLQCMVPELLELNDGNLPDEIPFQLLSELNAVAYKQAC